ncbi:MAG TPA: right-handed parallel beta-helix repeat-containing protein [Kofleriaceae bacterium]|nr:right-handed parallel beta-helix repeat-containing protein [Kofleriaceae bacterium]
MRSGWLAVIWLVGGCRSGFDDLSDARGRGDANDARGDTGTVLDDASDGSTDGSVPLTCTGRTPITGQTWWVATTGNDSNAGTQASPVATITKAVTLASATGGTVVVTPGAYTAEPGGELTIMTTKPLRVVSEQRYRASVPRIVCQTCTDLTIESFEVGGASLPAISLNGGARVTVLDNVVHDSGSAGIRVTSSADTIAVIGNLVYDNAATDIHFNVTSNITVRGNIVFNATVSPNGLSKIWLEAAATAIVDGNIVFRERGNDNAYGVISLRATSATTIENNIVAASPNATSVFAPVGFNQASGSATIRHNTFVGPLPGNAFGIGVQSLSSGTYTFVNNVWASSGTAQPFTSGTAPGGTITVRHNLYWNAPNGPFTSGGSPNPTNDSESRVVDPGISFAAVPAAPTWSSSTQQFAGGATTVCDVRTQLVQALAALPATSPAVGGADPAQRPSTDVLGKQRPNPATLGAYEP